MKCEIADFIPHAVVWLNHVRTWKEAARYRERREDEGHTFLLGRSDGLVIDGGRGGNGARWLNHACVANCEAVEEGLRIFIGATREIAPGEVLFIDYALEVPPETGCATLAGHACRCGSNRCRGTMLNRS